MLLSAPLVNMSVLAGMSILALGCVPSISAPSATPVLTTNSLGGGVPLPRLRSDAAADPERTGYFSKHFSLIAKNLTGTVEFYTEVFSLGSERFSLFKSASASPSPTLDTHTKDAMALYTSRQQSLRRERTTATAFWSWYTLT